MCQFKSIILTENNILFLDNSNSHEVIIKYYNLNDKTNNPDFVRIELKPIYSLTSLNHDNWLFKIDQDYKPKWFIKEFEKQRVFNKLDVIMKNALNDKLKVLVLTGCSNLTDISRLKYCNELVKLDLSYCYSLTDISGLEQCVNLKYLYLHNCTSLTDISRLKYCDELAKLGLAGCSSLTDISGLEQCVNLVYLNLYNCTSLTNFKEIIEKLEQNNVTLYR